jgi:hypothetical protein
LLSDVNKDFIIVVIIDFVLYSTLTFRQILLRNCMFVFICHFIFIIWGWRWDWVSLGEGCGKEEEEDEEEEAFLRF